METKQEQQTPLNEELTKEQQEQIALNKLRMLFAAVKEAEQM